MNDFELYIFVKGWLKNICFNKYCFFFFIDRKVKKNLIKILFEFLVKIVLDNNIILVLIFVVIILIGVC